MAGKLLKTVLKQAGITQDELAESVDVSQGMIGHIINGRKKASLELAIKISEKINRPLDEIFEPDDVTNYELIKKASQDAHPKVHTISETRLQYYPLYYEKNNKTDEYEILRSDVDFFPISLSLGKDTLIKMSKKKIPNTYQLYKLLRNNEMVKVLRRVRIDGFDTYLIPDGIGQEYKLSDYEHEFEGSLTAIKVIF